MTFQKLRGGRSREGIREGFFPFYLEERPIWEKNKGSDRHGI